MLCKAKFAVFSEIRAKTMNVKRTPCRVSERYSWWCVENSLGFKTVGQCSLKVKYYEAMHQAKFPSLCHRLYFCK